MVGSKGHSKMANSMAFKIQGLSKPSCETDFLNFFFFLLQSCGFKKHTNYWGID